MVVTNKQTKQTHVSYSFSENSQSKLRHRYKIFTFIKRNFKVNSYFL